MRRNLEDGFPAKFVQPENGSWVRSFSNRLSPTRIRTRQVRKLSPKLRNEIFRYKVRRSSRFVIAPLPVRVLKSKHLTSESPGPRLSGPEGLPLVATRQRPGLRKLTSRGARSSNRPNRRFLRRLHRELRLRFQDVSFIKFTKMDRRQGLLS